MQLYGQQQASVPAVNRTNKIACRHIVAAVVATLSCWLSLVKAVLLVLETIVYA